VYNIVLQLLTVRIHKAYTTQLRFVVYVKYTTQLRVVVYFCASNYSKQLKNIIDFRALTFYSRVLSLISFQNEAHIIQARKTSKYENKKNEAS